MAEAAPAREGDDREQGEDGERNERQPRVPTRLWLDGLHGLRS
jgi:hypothetical protein